MQYFKKIDIFGQQIGFEQCGSVTYKTWQGAIFTLIIAIIGSVIGFLFGQEIYQRQESISSFGKDLIDESIMDFNQSSIVFGVNSVNGTLLKNPFDYFDVQVEMYSINKTLNVKIDKLSINQCNSKTLPFRLKNTLCDVSPGCMCLDPNDKIYTMNRFGNANSRSLILNFIPCNPKIRTCPSDMDSKLRNFYFSVGIMNSYVEINNYTEPIKYYRQNLLFLQSKDFYSRVLISMTNNTLIADNGWLLEDKVEYKYVQLLDYKNEIMIYYPGITPIGAFIFDSPNIVDKITRSYMKLQDLFAKIGGMINALVILMKLISSHYIRFLYLLKLVKLSKENKTNKIINNKNNKASHIEKINVSTIHFKPLESRNKISEINPAKVSAVSEILRNLNDFEVEESTVFEKSYFDFILHAVCCKLSSLKSRKQMKLMEKKLEVTTKIKMLDYFYYNKHEVIKNP